MNAYQTLVEEELPIVAADGVRQTLRIVRPAAPIFSPWLVLGLPAMGTPASYYEPFARALADGLHAVVAFAELRGQGTSSALASEGARFGYREILEADLPAILEALRIRYPGRRLLIAGHSLGGQLAAMFAAQHADQIDGLVLMAAGTACIDAWFGPQRLLYRGLVAVVRATRWLWRWYPGRLIGFGGRQPHALMRDWLDVVATGRYRPRGTTVNYESRCPFASFDLLEIGIEGDPIAPPGAREELAARFTSARVTHTELPRLASGSAWRGHFAWAREPDAMVTAILRWMRTRRRARVQPFVQPDRTVARQVA